ncbi:hypothetical protein [Hahella sp. HN01]|uniref:hypothetical protein n=1 Tax=Hahella sp. HN01 TaxID=2847262 RepID=UPI001C1EE8E8|nr:hypothetical protein [Hahella sp. HN01]MBU6954531.1 hypothetical protein [Hahella sp. HN01]
MAAKKVKVKAKHRIVDIDQKGRHVIPAGTEFEASEAWVSKREQALESVIPKPAAPEVNVGDDD